MSRSLVTIGHYWNSVDARLARIHLEAAGIDSVLQNEHSVTMNWLEVANASRGVQLQVDEADVEAAMRVLEEKVPPTDEAGNPWASEPAHGEVPPDGASSDDPNSHLDDTSTDDASTDDREYTSLNQREHLIQRGYIAAMLGILFLPLEFFALYQLIPTLFMKEPLRASIRRKSHHAWITIGLVTLAYLMFVAQVTGHIPAPDPPANPPSGN